MFGIANRLAQYPLPRKIIGRLRMMGRRNLHDFWRQSDPEGNEPSRYIAPEAWQRSEALLGMISDLPKNARIMEVGCNIGRNLAHLYRAGYRNLEAIEISPHAVRALRETFPELVDIPIYQLPAEKLLPDVRANSCDLIFTMAVLEHIHPASISVFDDIARAAKRIIAIEPTTHHISTRQFPHDIEAIFTARGFDLTSKTPLDHVSGLETYSAYQFRERAPQRASGSRRAESRRP